MQRPDPHLRVYVVALAVVGCAVALQFVLWPLIHPSPFLLLSIAILISGLGGTWGPGLFATALAVVAANVLFLDPDAWVAVGWRDLLTVSAFGAVGVGITWLNVSRRRSQYLAAEQSQWLGTTLRSIGDAVIATDRDGRVQFLNPIAERLTGWPASEAIGKPLDEIFKIVNEQSRRAVESPVDRVIRERRVVGLANHTVLIARDGEELIIEDSGAPICDEHGKLSGVVLVFRDSTGKSRDEERKEMLAATTVALASSLDLDVTLKRAAAAAVPRFADWCAVHLVEPTGELRLVAVHHFDSANIEIDPSWQLGIENVVRTGESEWAAGARSYIRSPLRARGRTLGVLSFVTAESGRRYSPTDVAFAEALAERVANAVENARLYTKSQDAIYARDEFLAVASHELKTPLATLQLQLDSFHDTLAYALENNARLTRQLASAHRQLLRLGNLVEGLLDVSRITTGRLVLKTEDVDLVEVAEEVIERLDGEARIAGCELRFEADRDGVIGKWDRLRLDQVLTNLVANALKYGAGKPVTVFVSEHDGVARSAVRDEGIGIAADDIARIFGRFERAVSTRHYGGLGLGLFIAQQIVEAHGGQIHVASRPNQGSEFTVLLPIAEQARIRAEERVQ